MAEGIGLDAVIGNKINLILCDLQECLSHSYLLINLHDIILFEACNFKGGHPWVSQAAFHHHTLVVVGPLGEYVMMEHEDR